MGHPTAVYELVWQHMEAQDWDRFMELFGPEPTMKFQDGSFQGRELTLRYFRAVMDHFPDIRHRTTAIVEAADGSSMAGWVVAGATGTGNRNLFGSDVDATGKRMYFEAVDFLFFEAGKISAWWAMLDLESHVRELGVELSVRPPTV